MSSSQYIRLGVYSRSSAPGIIIAHGKRACMRACVCACDCDCDCMRVICVGNYGSRLLDNPDLYISRDGGLRWEQVSDTYMICILLY